MRHSPYPLLQLHHRLKIKLEAQLQQVKEQIASTTVWKNKALAELTEHEESYVSKTSQVQATFWRKLA